MRIIYIRSFWLFEKFCIWSNGFSSFFLFKLILFIWFPFCTHSKGKQNLFKNSHIFLSSSKQALPLKQNQKFPLHKNFERSEMKIFYMIISTKKGDFEIKCKGKKKKTYQFTEVGNIFWLWWPVGLLRCGKSCRLRWTNYLRPDLKRGLLSEYEEKMVIDLHAQLGNRFCSKSNPFSCILFCLLYSACLFLNFDNSSFDETNKAQWS